MKARISAATLGGRCRGRPEGRPHESGGEPVYSGSGAGPSGVAVLIVQFLSSLARLPEPIEQVPSQTGEKSLGKGGSPRSSRLCWSESVFQELAWQRRVPPGVAGAATHQRVRSSMSAAALAAAPNPTAKRRRRPVASL